MKMGYGLAAAGLLVGCWSDNPRHTPSADAGLSDVRVSGAFVTVGSARTNADGTLLLQGDGFEISPRVCREGDASAVCVSGGIVP